MPTSLTQETRVALHAALLDAFDRAGLASMLSLGLGERSERILRPGTLSDEVLQLVHWAEDTGRVEDLLRAASEAQSENQTLRKAIKAIRAAPGPAEPSPPPEASFDPWRPAVPPGFVGRVDALRDLERFVEAGQSASVVGDKLIGKSSLLATWAIELGRRGRVVRAVDGRAGALADAPTVGALVEAITGEEAPDDVAPAIRALSGWASREGRPGLPPVVVFDHADGALRNLPYRFWERARGLLDQLCWVLATRREVEAIYRDQGRGSPFGPRLRTLQLGLLDAEGASALVARLADREEHALLEAWCGRHPYYLQLLGRLLQEGREAGRSRQATLDRFQAEAGRRLRSLWGAMPERDQRALLASLDGRCWRGSLKRRGLITAEGAPFGRVFAEWLREEA